MTFVQFNILTKWRKIKKKKNLISLSRCVSISFLLFWSMILSLSLSLCECMCICFLLLFWSMSLSSFLIYDSDLWFFLLFWSMILSLSLGVCMYVYLFPFFFSDLWFFLHFWSMILSSFLEILSQWVLLQLQYRKKKEEGEKN